MPIYLIDYGRLGKTRKDVPEEVNMNYMGQGHIPNTIFELRWR